jgi:PAS domain S-box-containing protein
VIKTAVQTEPDIRSVYQSVFDENPLGIVLSDLEGRIGQVNAEFERMLGYSQAELAGKDWVDITHPDDLIQGRKDVIVLRSGKVRSLIMRKRYVAKSGGEVWSRVTISTASTGNLRAGFVTMVEDITEQVRTEMALAEKQRLLGEVLDSAPLVMLACDLYGTVTMCERRAIGDGAEGWAEAIGRSIWDVVGEPDLVREHFAMALAGQGGRATTRIAGRTYEYHYRPVLDDSGKVNGVTAVALDISDRETAVEQNRQVTKFTAALSHELRTPLNTIIGFNELLSAAKAGPLNEKQIHYVDLVDKGARLLLSLINDLLDLSKVKAGQMTVEPEPIDALAAVRNVVAQMEPLAIKKGVDLLVLDSRAKMPMVADGRRLHQVLLNLLSNAVKFTPGGASITVSVRQEAGNTSFAVTDAGSGIPAEQIESVFDEYRQLGSGASSPTEGTGLGLPLSRRFAELMGGTLAAESAVGQGSRFTLSLPSVFGAPALPTVVARSLAPASADDAMGAVAARPRQRHSLSSGDRRRRRVTGFDTAAREGAPAEWTGFRRPRLESWPLAVDGSVVSALSLGLTVRRWSSPSRRPASINHGNA